MTGTSDTPHAAKLSIVKAVGHALISADIDFYPRVQTDDGIQTLETQAMLAEMGIASADWHRLDGEKLETAIKLARQSLDEVKQQTEYQDQKATRLLTVTTFLTALSGALFARFNDGYPFAVSAYPNWLHLVLVGLAYAAFALFLLAALCGALVTFHATRTRFKYESIGEHAAESGAPKSRIFYVPMLRVRPRAWVKSFQADENPAKPHARPTLHDKLQHRYFTDLLGEAYLVASKTADKLRYLEPAQSLLAWSLRFLFLWLIVLALVGAFVAKQPAKPTAVMLVEAPVAATPEAPADTPKVTPPTVPPAPAPGNDAAAVKGKPQADPGPTIGNMSDKAGS